MAGVQNQRLEKSVVAAAARGYWVGLILALCPGVHSGHLTGRHGPCPKCGGKDRFHVFRDFGDVGGAMCHNGSGDTGEGCFTTQNGDGFAFLQWYNGWTFERSLEAVAELLGVTVEDGGRVSMKPASGLKKSKPVAQKKVVDPFSLWQQRDVSAGDLAGVVNLWAVAKPGVVASAVLSSDVMVGTWNDGSTDFEVLGFRGYNNDINGKLVPCALHIYRADGVDFPESRTAGVRKNHNVYGSKNGWVIVGGFDRFEAADVVWKVEGLTDAFALLPLLPAHHSVVTMTNGCAWRSGSDKMPPLSVFYGRRVIVCGDCDVPGQSGAEMFAADVLAVAAGVWFARMPYPLERSHGADLRDWCAAAVRSWADVRALLVEWEWLLQSRLALFGEGARVTSRRGFGLQDRTDEGNADHYAAYSKNLLRYHHAWKKWLVWDGCRWRGDDTGRPVIIAKRVLAEMRADASDDADSMAFVAKTARRERINAMITLAQPELAVTTDQLDRDGWLLNCPNGTVNLRTGELHLHRQTDFQTKVCGVPFDSEAQCPRWEQFLAEVFANHLDVIPFLQRFFGCCLTGDISEQKLPVFWGKGSNGKSTLLNTVKAVLGGGYTMQAQADLLIDRKVDQHPTELADLFGKRLVICAETEQGRRLAEAKLKALTGGEPIRARRMREDFWEFVPECKLILVTNHKPHVFGTDYGIWRRLMLVPFAERFSGDRKDPELPERLVGEYSGILAWMVRGCLDWQVYGLEPPASIVAATEDYAGEEDIVGRYVKQMCIRTETARVKARDLNHSFHGWCDDVGEPKLSPKKLAAWLEEAGVQRVRSNGIYWVGVGLLGEGESGHDDDDDFYSR